MNKASKRTLGNLYGVHHKLVAVVAYALAISEIDFFVNVAVIFVRRSGILQEVYCITLVPIYLTTFAFDTVRYDAIRYDAVIRLLDYVGNDVELRNEHECEYENTNTKSGTPPSIGIVVYAYCM